MSSEHQFPATDGAQAYRGIALPSSFLDSGPALAAAARIAHPVIAP